MCIYSLINGSKDDSFSINGMSGLAQNGGLVWSRHNKFPSTWLRKHHHQLNSTLPPSFHKYFSSSTLIKESKPSPPPRFLLTCQHRAMESSINGVAGGRGSNNGVDKGVDFANYFCTYAYLYHQKEMLCDRVRMDAYYNAIFENKEHFAGKTVLDVGTGSGILAIWSAQAGARKVYAVEATKMSDHARQLVKANNFEGVVEVIEGTVEDITLPEKVDVIISEWMGYFLLRESMFDSVICARDRWLKPTGVMYPSHARMWLAPMRSGVGDQKMSDFNSSMEDWYKFIDETKADYGVDMGVLTQPFREEQKKYYLQTSMWNNLHPNQIIGVPAIIKEIDCLTATVSELLNVRANFASSITLEDTRFCGFAGWFDVHFRGSSENPARHEIELTTAPSLDNGTHWGQQVFLVHPPLRAQEGDEMAVSFSMIRSKENHRLMEVEFICEMKESSGKKLHPFTKKFFIE